MQPIPEGWELSAPATPSSQAWAGDSPNNPAYSVPDTNYDQTNLGVSLQQEIANAKTPAIRATLIAEFQKRQALRQSIPDGWELSSQQELPSAQTQQPPDGWEFSQPQPLPVSSSQSSLPAGWEVTPSPKSPSDTPPEDGSTIVQNITGAVTGIGEMASMASKIAYPLTHMGTVIGGWAGIKDLVTGQGLDKAVADIQKYQDWNATGLIQKAGIDDKYLTNNAGYKTVMKPLDWLTEKAAQAGGWVADTTGSPIAGTAVDLVGQMLPFVIAGGIKEAAFPKDAKAQQALGEARTKALIDQLTSALPGVTSDRVKYQMPEGENPRAHLETMINNGSSLLDVLDHLSDHPDLHQDNGEGIKLAQAFAQRGWDLGLDKTAFVIDRTLPKPAQYDSVGDVIAVKDGAVAPDAILHEAVHAINAGAENLYNEIQAGTAKARDGTPLKLETLSPTQRDIYYRVKDLEFLRDKAATFLQPEVARLQAEGKSVRDFYGLKDVGEFMSELNANGRFRELIGKVPADKSTLPEIPKVPRSFKSLYDIAKQALKRLILPDATPLLSSAMDHFQGLIDHMTPDVRGWSMKDTLYNPEDRTSPATGRSLMAETNIKKVMERHDVDAARAKVTIRDGQFLMYRLSDILRNAATPKEFYSRARALWSDPEFQKFIDANGDKILRSPVTFIKAFHIDNSFDKLSSDEQLLTANHLSVDDFMRKHKELAAAMYKKRGITDANPDDPKFQLMTKDDLFDDGTFLLPQTQLKMIKAGAKAQLSGLVLKYFAEKGDEYRALGAQMYYRGLNMMEEYSSLPNKSKKNVIQTAMRYDNAAGRSTLKAMGLQWPTKEMLQAPDIGLNDAEVSAYQGIAHAMDHAHDLINQALAKDGKPQIEQIPGYFPHFFEGAYRVLIDRIVKNDDGTSKTFTFRVRGFATRQGAQKFVDQLNSGKFDPAGETWRPKFNPDSGESYFVQEHQYKTMSLTDNLYETINSNRAMEQLDPVARDALEKIESEALKGSIKHILERSDVEGYRGDLVNDMGFNKGILARIGMDAYNNRLLKTHEVYMKNVSEFYKNTMFMNEVATKLFDHAPIGSGEQYYGTYLDKMKMLKEYIKEQTANFTGENFNHLNMMIEREIKPMAKWAGLDPEIASKSMHAARNFLSLTKLRGNVGFYVGNFVQPLHMASILSWANEMRRQGGHKIDYTAPMKAFYKAMSNRNDPMLKESLQWATDNHIIDDAMLEYQMRAKAPSTIMNWVHTLTGGKINPHIEMMARSYSFAIAHEFYRKIYGDDSMKVRRAAQQAMEMVNVNYDRSTRPLMYQNFGMAGEAMSPFAVYRNAYIGNNWLMFKAIKSGKFTPQSFIPLLHFQLIYLATAGAAGLMMTDEWDQLAKMWNYFAPGHPLMDSQQASLYLQHKVGASDAFTFGAVSQATKLIPGLEHGVNLGSSMTASGLDSTLTTALNPFLAAIGELAVVGTKATAHAAMPSDFPGVSFADVWPAAEALVPQPLRGPLEMLGQPNRSVAMKTTKYEGYVERTQPDENSMLALGRMSVTEAKSRIVEKRVAEKAEWDKAHLKELVSNAATFSQSGGRSQQTYDEAQAQATNDLGISSDDFAKMVADEEMNRITTTRQREDLLESVAAARSRLERENMGGYDDNR